MPCSPLPITAGAVTVPCQYTIRTLAVLQALLDEATIQQIVVLLSVIDDYADQAQTATRNITALLQSL
jgi:hypothetical protein